MFHSPKAPYTTSNKFTNFTPSFYTIPYILSHVVPTFFASDPPEPKFHGYRILVALLPYILPSSLLTSYRSLVTAHCSQDSTPHAYLSHI